MGRTELKYLISAASCRLIISRLSSVLPFDTHATGDGSYFVRSLYFDSMIFQGFFDKEAGLRDRRKFRIRYYNGDRSFIRLEEKEKIGSFSTKTGVRISVESFENLAERKGSLGPFDHPLLEDFNRRVRTGSLFPILFTDYLRTSFCHPVGDLRVTLDRGVTASHFSGDVWRPGASVPLMKSGEAILEIKYSGVYPAHILDLIRDIPKTQTAVSKYCLCCQALY